MNNSREEHYRIVMKLKIHLWKLCKHQVTHKT